MRLTAPGAAGIAVVRLCGLGVREFLEKRFSTKVRLRRCVYGELTDGDRAIDDAVVVLCDDLTADLNVHGGSWVVHAVLDLAEREGFQISLGQPGAPLADEMVDADSQLQREVLRFLPLARTETGVRALLAQDQAWRDLQSRHTIGRARLPPSSDAFAAETGGSAGASPSQAGASPSQELEATLADRTLEHLLFPPTIAIVGPANAGKSTLANQLFAQQRSITADVPGTTRDWVGEFANIEGLPVMLVDTPGLRATEDPIERTAIERSREQIEKSQLVVLVLDATRPLAGEQESLLARFPGALSVVNKIDLPMGMGIGELWATQTVATSGQGVDELRGRVIECFCGERMIAIDRPRLWTPRQRQIIEGVLDGRRSFDDLWAIQ
ncbi:MAG TPA: GTPase [Tepidisphaeraceae bacterium]|nr:GTPase [Tepidisphaeraceae bacterium]